MSQPQEFASALVKDLGPRFNLVSLVPTASLALFVLAAFGTGLPTESPSLVNLEGALKGLSAAEIVALSLLVLLVALLSYPFQVSMVRLLEGYWTASGLGAAVAEVGTELNRRRVLRLEGAQEQDTPIPFSRWTARGSRAEETDRTKRERARRQTTTAEQLFAYPEIEKLLPTRLGNALRAAESRAGQRWGLETITMWPRLYPYLSDRTVAMLKDRRDDLDIAVRWCLVLTAATAIFAALLLIHVGFGVRQRDALWLLVPGATALLASIAYQTAVRAALAYGAGLEVAFDLHRFEMLRGLHKKLPAAAEEWDANRKLSAVFQGRQSRSKIRPGVYDYDHDDRDCAPGSAAAHGGFTDQDSAASASTLGPPPTPEGERQVGLLALLRRLRRSRARSR